MTKREPKSQPTWTDVKAKLAAFDRTALLDLLHHLYATHKDNQAFLHARFGLGGTCQPHGGQAQAAGQHHSRCEPSDS